MVETLKDNEVQPLGQLLLAAYGLGLLEARLQMPEFALEVSERPVASPLARLQLLSGDTVTSLLHTTLDIHDPLAKNLLLLLDGTRDRAALVRELCDLVDSGVATLQKDGEPL